MAFWSVLVFALVTTNPADAQTATDTTIALTSGANPSFYLDSLTLSLIHI